MADDAGALLVRSGLIRSDDLAAARIACADVGGTIGEHLVAAGLVADELLTEFYRSRLLVPQVNPNNLARLAAALISVIPGDMAVELRVVPVAIDREGNLTVAMSDPSDRHAVDEISFFTGKYVVRAVATQMQIAWCLAHYYGHVTELGRRLLRPSRNGAADATPAAAPPRSRGDTGRVEALRKKVQPPTTQSPVNDSDVVHAIRREDGGGAPGSGRIAAIRPIGSGSPTLVGIAPGPILAGAAVAIAPALDEPEPARAPAADSAVPTPAIDRDAEPEDDAAWEAALARARAATADAVDGDGDGHGDDDAASWEAALARARAATADEELIDEDPAPDADSDRNAIPHRDESDADADADDGDDGDGDDEPEIQIGDVSGPVGIAVHADTQPTGPTVNRLRTEDELADRHGEVEVRAPQQPRDLDLPAVVVGELASPPVVIEAGGRTSVPSAITRPGSDQEGHGSADDERTLDGLDDGDGLAADDELDDDRPPDGLVDDGVDQEIDDGPSQPILLLQHRRPETVDVAIPDGPGPDDDDDDDPEVTDNDGTSVTVRAAVAVKARPPAATDADDDNDDDRAAAEFDEGVTPPPATVDIVLLDRKKPETPPVLRRPERPTQVGVGAVGARRRRHSMRPDQGITQPMVDVLLTAPPEIPALVDTTVRVPVDFAPDHAAPSVPDLVRRPPWTAADSPPARPHPVIDTPTLKTVGTPSHGDPPSGPSGRVAAPQSATSSDQVVDGVPRFVQDDENSNTRRHESTRNRRSSKSMSEIDDDWGPPGSTIPPPFLGVMAGVDDDAPAGRIPILADDDLSGPLLVAPPSPPEDRPRRTPVPGDAVPVAASPGASASPLPASLSRPHPIELARDLEAASTRLVELLRDLDRAHSRDGVIEVLVELLVDSHAQAAFFAVRGGELHPFATRPAAPGAGSATLRLDAASTFQDVVGTRLPYRGPLVDDASRALVINTFGSQPDEVLVIPVAVRDRVVGVLYGAGRRRHTFDEHLALAARAAGLAFERILKAKRTPVP